MQQLGADLGRAAEADRPAARQYMLIASHGHRLAALGQHVSTVGRLVDQDESAIAHHDTRVIARRAPVIEPHLARVLAAHAERVAFAPHLPAAAAKFDPQQERLARLARGREHALRQRLLRTPQQFPHRHVAGASANADQLQLARLRAMHRGKLLDAVCGSEDLPRPRYFDEARGDVHAVAEYITLGLYHRPVVDADTHCDPLGFGHLQPE